MTMSQLLNNEYAEDVKIDEGEGIWDNSRRNWRKSSASSYCER